MNTNNAVVLLASRVMVAALFVVFGIRKAMAVAGTTKYFATLGLPMPEVMVWLVILVEIVGGVLLILGWKTRIAAWVLALFVLLATFAAHRFWQFEGAQYVPQLTNFMKNLTIAGGLMALAACGPGRLSVDKA